MTAATVGRPRTPLDVAEALALARIATLAAQIMVSLREPGRGVYESERALQAFLSKDGVSYTTADLRPALALLESAGRIGRSPAKKNTRRRGWLITASENGSASPVDALDGAHVPEVVAATHEPGEAAAEEAPASSGDGSSSITEARIFALAKAIVNALGSGNGGGSRCTLEELPGRLAEDGVTHAPDELADVLTRLEDCGQILRVQRQPGYPQFLVENSRYPFDRVSALAADVCAAMKRRGERFEDEDQLTSWLDEDQVSYDPHTLSEALHQLERIGRLRRPRADQWRSDSPLPGIYVEPRIYVE